MTVWYMFTRVSGTDSSFHIAEFEATGRIIFEASDGEMLEVMIANADMSEPYMPGLASDQLRSKSSPSPMSTSGVLLTRTPLSR